MNNLRAKIAAARYIAVAREGDIRIKEFLRAITIGQEGGDAEPINLEVACHFRSWQKHISVVEAGHLEAMSQADLSDVIALWVQDAIDKNLLSLSDPPRASGTEPFSVGDVVTYIYSKECMLVGKRWG